MTTTSSFKILLWTSLSLLVLNGIGYSGILHAPFNYDDGLVVLHNQAIRNLDTYLQVSNIQYRQLFYLSFAFNYLWGQDNPFGYHVFNVAVHFANSLLVLVAAYWTVERGMELSRQASLRVACFTSLWFALNPIQTEAVTYVSGRTSSMMAFFYLLSLLGFIFATMKSTRLVPTILGYLFAVACGGLALFCKETAATLPLALFLYDLCFMRNERFKSFRYRLWAVYLPIPLIIASGVLASASMREHVADWMSRINFGYALEQAKVLPFSIKMVLFPINQTFDYEFPHASMAVDSLRIATTSGVVLLTVFLLFKLYQMAPWAAFGITWYLLILGPTNSFLPRMDLLSERNLYLPSFGLLLAVAIAWEKAGFSEGAPPHRRQIASAAMVILLISSGALLLHRNAAYQDNTRLWEDALEKAPGKPRIYHNLSHFYTQAGDYKKAFVMLKKLASSKATPYYRAYAHTNIGNIQALWGNMDEAERNFIKALEIYPPLPSSHFNIGVLYASKGMFQEANAAFEQAQKAQESYERYLLPPTFFLYRGRVLIQLNRFEEAEKFLLSYNQTSPGDPEGLLLLAQVFQQTGREDAALQLFERLREPASVLAEAQASMAYLFLKQGNHLQALQALTRSVEADPNRSDRQFELARLMWKENRNPKAAEHLKAALNLHPPANLTIEIERLLTEIESQN